MDVQQLARYESKGLKGGNTDEQKALTDHLHAIQQTGVQLENRFNRGAESEKLLNMLEGAHQVGHLLLHMSLFFAAAKSDGYSVTVMNSLIKFALAHRVLSNNSGFLPSCLWILYAFVDSHGKQGFAITSVLLFI
jgi:hypothetical protein